MADTLTFLHTADLHLGAPMRGFRDLSPAWEERLQRAIAESYDRVVETALETRVDFVVLAGDAFDTSGASYGDFAHFFNGLERLHAAGIPVYLVAGNHDPLTTWHSDVSRLPPSAHMLGGDAPGFALYEREGEPLCLIGGRGYRNQAWPLDEPIAGGISRADAVAALGGSGGRAAEAPFCLGIIHTGLDIDQSKAFSDPQALLAADVDYWACGHLHLHCTFPSADDPRIVFPGCVQGRDLKESGERGCFLVTLEQRPGARRAQVSLDFVPTASVVFHTMEVDVGPCITLADVARLVQARLFEENAKVSCDEMVVRIVLVGESALHGFLRQPEVIRDLRKRINNAYPTFFCDALVDHTRPPRDLQALRGAGLFTAHALRVADEQRMHPEQMVNYIQAEFVKRGIDVPASLTRRIGDFNEAAETLVLDLLEEDQA